LLLQQFGKAQFKYLDGSTHGLFQSLTPVVAGETNKTFSEKPSEIQTSDFSNTK
jgi:hypothetical protein